MSGRAWSLLFLGAVLVAGGGIVWNLEALNLAVSKYLISIQSLQRGLHLGLSVALRRVEEDGFTASAMLVGLSFFYGIFHAAGPGHGKIVISTYLLSHRSHLKRGIVLSFASSMIQGLTAILLVTLAVWLLGRTMRQTQIMVNDVEVASFALIALVGLLIVISRSFSLIRSTGIFARGRSGAGPGDDNGHEHGDHCGHSHGPTAAQLEAPLSVGTFLAIVLSVGIRPCSGAVIVLLLAYSLNLQLVGFVAVLAMSIGTALTISVLATMAVYIRHAATRFLAVMPTGSAMAGRLADVVGVVGGGVIFAVGVMLVDASLFSPAHPLR